MKRQATWSSQQGLLLLEAVLSALVIAVGLVFISRALSQQLRALHDVEQHDALLALAQGTLEELEARVQAKRAPQQIVGVPFAEPYGEAYREYRWTLEATRLSADEPDDDQTVVRLASVALTVQRGDPPTALVTLSAIWPTAMLPEEWFE